MLVKQFLGYFSVVELFVLVQKMQLSSKQEVSNLQQHEFAGRHMLASYFNCDESTIKDAQRCLAALRNAAAAGGVNVVAENVHHFPNGAVTAILLLAESHASIHTYPEHRSCFIDFYLRRGRY
ncbi:MAG: S-adenosylmethionine decarboxylase [Candidatus Obscuribacterales bacterium]